MLKRLLATLMALALTLIFVGCGNNDSGVADEEKDTEEVVDEVESEDDTAETEDYTVGSTFESDGISITLNSATYYPGDEYHTPPEGSQYILLNFTITNNNDEDYEMGEIGFSTVIDGSHAETLAIAPNYLQTITLLPDSNTSGDLDYEVPNGWTEIRTEARIGAVNGEKATFTITPDQVG